LARCWAAARNAAVVAQAHRPRISPESLDKRDRRVSVSRGGSSAVSTGSHGIRWAGSRSSLLTGRHAADTRESPDVTWCYPVPAMDRPPTRFAWNGEVSLAYQVCGVGASDLVYPQGYCSTVDMNWESPYLSRFLRGLAAHARLGRRAWPAP